MSDRKRELQAKQDDGSITLDELLELRDIIRKELSERGLR